MTNEKYVPYCIEPSLGADRVTLAFLCEAYDEEDLSTEEKTDSRTVLRFHPAIAPVKAAVLPLVKKLSDDAYKLYERLSKQFVCEFDEAGAIGRRYRRQDEIGTPFCITYDFQTKGEDGNPGRPFGHRTLPRFHGTDPAADRQPGGMAFKADCILKRSGCILLRHIKIRRFIQNE